MANVPGVAVDDAVGRLPEAGGGAGRGRIGDVTTPSPPARPAPRGAGWIHWQGRVHRLAEALLVGDGARGGREFWVRDPEAFADALGSPLPR